MAADTPVQPDLRVEFLPTLGEISQGEWDGLADTDYPFLQYKFLRGLETTHCTTAESGWQPCHAIVRNQQQAVAIMPLYLKSHSYGEYVFDWAWADAWRQLGLSYYPKLVSAIPFTPSTGPRICVEKGRDVEAIYQALLSAVYKFAEGKQISSWHLLFPEEALAQRFSARGLHLRVATQFHWFNDNFAHFDDFLATFNSRKRKSLKRERQRVAQQGITLRTLVGDDIGPTQWQQFYRFYQLTYARRSGHGGYLSKEFFTQIAASMGQQVIMVLADLDGHAVAGALYFRSGDTLFGRYWGAEQDYDCLHFEACYYRGIEFCIANGLKRFDPGAQGEHKIQRGFRPTKTFSSHWIADPQLSAAVADFTRTEQAQVDGYISQAAELLPFKSSS
jgi:uncharacterized protein